MYINSDIIKFSIFSTFLFFISCTAKKQDNPFFAGEYPGIASAQISDNQLKLSNLALEAIWEIKNNSVTAKEFINKYDGKTVSFNNIILFAIETEGGKILTNLDFQIHGKPEIKEITVNDSLPTRALRFAGKEIIAKLSDSEKNILVTWKAQLRDGSNYIRQNIEITTIRNPLKFSKVIFFDGKLDGSVISGLVPGSPIENGNFFFGLEHPIAHSKALMSRQIGNLKQEEIELSEFINCAGEYIFTIEAGSGHIDFNVNRFILLENGLPVSTSAHPYTGENGGSSYLLRLDSYKPDAKYSLKTEVENREKASGDIYIHQKTYDILNFYVNRADELVPGKSISEWAVIGVAPEGQKRRAFQYYLECERARPYKQFLHYNCWWDITDDGASSFTSEQLIERMEEWNEKFIKPFGVPLNSFVFDDGWDNPDSVWYFDPVKFPQGFAPQAELCRKYNSGIGVWMSPFGGYLENKSRRVESAHREGLETNDKGLSLAGANYYNRFLERALDMLDNYKVNYFKFDGFGGSEPKYLPDMEAGARLIKTLRQHNPDVFVNITVGSWPSPFWLKYADCTWRGSGDLHMAGPGSRTQRFMTYRDGTLHNNIVGKAPYYPLNSIMTVGIAYANLGHPMKCINDSIGDFSDMIWSFFSSGTALQELYISPNRMKPEFWPILAEAALWAKENEDVLSDTHWIGGSPINLEVYGFASWSPRKGIIMLRNPDEKVKVFKSTLNEILEIPLKYRGKFSIKTKYSTEGNKSIEIVLEGENNLMLELKPFETRILEIIPE